MKEIEQNEEDDESEAAPRINRKEVAKQKKAKIITDGNVLGIFIHKSTLASKLPHSKQEEGGEEEESMSDG